MAMQRALECLRANRLMLALWLSHFMVNLPREGAAEPGALFLR
jgi:hypothetical protein